MKKDITICFRTSSDIRNYLADIARQQRRSLSSVLESLITRHQHGLSASNALDSDRRRYKRKKILLPAFIGDAPTSSLGAETGFVRDISIGGIRFTLPQKAASEIQPKDHTGCYHVAFTLPGQNQPVRLQCLTRSVMDAAEEIQIGAAFVDAEFTSYQRLLTYLS